MKHLTGLESFVLGFVCGLAACHVGYIIYLVFQINKSYNKEAKLVKFDSEVDRLLEPDHLQDYYNEEYR